MVEQSGEVSAISGRRGSALATILRTCTPASHPLLIHASPSASISLSSSTATYLVCSRFSIGLPHSFNMPTIGNLHMSLYRRCAVPTSPTFPHASLRQLRHARIKRIPLVACRTSFTTPSSSKLVVSGELTRFPLSKSNFSDIRGLPGLAYFDKTEYISELQDGTDVQLFCHPKRFGKSLTVTMLRHFHGFQFRKQYNKLFKVCGCRMFLGQAQQGAEQGRTVTTTQLKMTT